MNSQSTLTSHPSAVDEDAIRGIHQQMINAWNTGSGAAFAAPFTTDADFVVFEGTHLKGRQEIASFTQEIFDTVVKGSHLEGEVKFVRFLGPKLAVMHSVVSTILPGHTEAAPGRDSMQMYVVTNHDGEWQAEAILNARRLTMDRQFFLDDFDSLPADAQSEVVDLIASLKQKSHKPHR